MVFLFIQTTATRHRASPLLRRINGESLFQYLIISMRANYHKLLIEGKFIESSTVLRRTIISYGGASEVRLPPKDHVTADRWGAEEGG